MKLRILNVAAAAVVLLSGCATTSTTKLYPGPERAPGEVASVVVPWQVQVRNVNGMKVPIALFAGSVKESTVCILPGPQEWSVRYYDPFADERSDYDSNPYIVDRTGPVSLQFTADAGHTYQVTFETPEQNPALRDAVQKVKFRVVESGREVAQPVIEQAAAQAGSKPAVADEGGPARVEPVALEAATLDQLKKWWNVAGSAERKAFMEWANEKN
jgi:hypothetical protein